MKHTLSFIALVAICSSMMVSCKNKQSEPTPEEIEAQKVALADSVLAIIDKYAEDSFDARTRAISFRSMELTDAEKLNKPDFLLDPSSINSLVTRSQKINALGIFLIDLGVIYLYDMPADETKEAMSKLAVELNIPVELSAPTDQRDFSDIARQSYNNCKEKGKLNDYWQLESAMVDEIVYILVHNPELYFSKIDEVQWDALNTRWNTVMNVIDELAKYDEEIAVVANSLKQFESSEGESDADYATKESAIQILVANKDLKIARRNALLQ